MTLFRHWLRTLAIPSGLGCLGLLLLVGCQSDKSSVPPPTPSATGSGEISELHLLSSPAAVSFDGRGGAAGFAVRIFASSPRSKRTVPISEGTLEVLMFDGILSVGTNPPPAPLRVWSFPADSLRGQARVSTVGTSYSLTLLWGDNKPTQNRITVTACLLTKRGARIYSALTTIFVNTP